MPVIVQGQTTKIAGRKSPWYDGPECLCLRSMQKGWCRLGLQSLQHTLRRQVGLGQQTLVPHQWLLYVWPLEARKALWIRGTQICAWPGLGFLSFRGKVCRTITRSSESWQGVYLNNQLEIHGG